MPGRKTPIIVWALVLLGGIALLYARYDWDVEGGRFAERGFALSAYLFVLLIPTCWHLARRLLNDTRVATGLTGIVFVATALPYHLLGLDDHYYYRERPQVFQISDALPASLEFFPGGTLRAFPYDYVFMPLLFAVGVALIWGLWALRNRAGRPSPRIYAVLLTVAFAAICTQAYVHSSMRAPYTYLAYFQKPEWRQHWYHVYHFADGSGATEADQFAFSPLEDYFHGAARDGDNELVRRPLSFYFASQGSYFVNTFYVWLGLNCLFWLVAVLATARLVTLLAGERPGRIAGALVAVGPGFVAFAATPAMYMQNYVAVVVALCLFEELIVRERRPGAGGFALFGGVLALCALVYDITPLFLVIAAYGIARKVELKPLLLTLGAAFVAARGFTFMVTTVLGIDIVPNNARQLSDALDEVAELVIDPSLAAWYDAIWQTLSTYPQFLLQAFFILPALLALYGWRKLRDPAQRVLVIGLLMMGFVVMSVFLVGKQNHLVIPRLVYPAFPAIYLLAALALADLGDRFRPYIPWIAIGVMAVLVNVDIFGYPTQYVEYFVGKRPAFLPG